MGSYPLEDLLFFMAITAVIIIGSAVVWSLRKR